MNINGRNAWKSGPFGAIVFSLDVLLATGEVRTLAPEQDRSSFMPSLEAWDYWALSHPITVQLQRLGSGLVSVRRRRAAGYG